MGNFHPRRRGWFLAALLCSLAAVVCEAGAQIPPASDAPPSHTPRESLAMFQVEPGFRVELVAAEPNLADPVAICFDADGTLFACELHGYNMEGHYDVVELNKTGRLDKSVRRIPAPDWAIEKAKRGQTGTVKKLIDDDGDGRVDRSTVFADNLPSFYGLVPAREGIIVVCAPSIYYLADRDGDGVAEIREELFHGFNEGQQWSRTNHLVWGVDNWIYACGDRGPERTCCRGRFATSQTAGPVYARRTPCGERPDRRSRARRQTLRGPRSRLPALRRRRWEARRSSTASNCCDRSTIHVQPRNQPDTHNQPGTGLLWATGRNDSWNRSPVGRCRKGKRRGQPHFSDLTFV